MPLGVALVFWGLPIALIAPRPYLACGDPAARGRRRREQRRGRRRLHAPAADRPRRAAQPRARPGLGSGDGRGCAGFDRGAGSRRRGRAARGLRRRRRDPPRAHAALLAPAAAIDREVAAPGGRARGRLRRAAVRAALARRQGAPRLEADAGCTSTPGEVVVRAGETGDRFYIVGERRARDHERRPRQLPAAATSSARSRCCATCRVRRPSAPPRPRSCTRSTATTSWRPSRTRPSARPVRRSPRSGSAPSDGSSLSSAA